MQISLFLAENISLKYEISLTSLTLYTVKNLGVLFERKFTFEAHVNSVCFRVHNTLRRLWPITRYMSVDMRKKLHYWKNKKLTAKYDKIRRISGRTFSKTNTSLVFE
jgi:hypothetical protein